MDAVWKLLAARVTIRTGRPPPEASLEADLLNGARSRVKLRCADCGYGAVVSAPPPRCPMCGCGAWELAPRHLFPAAPRH